MPGLSPRDTELAARLRAARGYGALTNSEIAAATHISPGHISHLIAGTKAIEDKHVANLIRSVARLSKLPMEFFTADLTRIGTLPADPRIAPTPATARGTDLEGLVPPFLPPASSETGTESA